MAEKIRIMHVTGSLNIGGVEELLWLTAKANPVDKYDLAFATCHSDDGVSSRQIQQLGYKVFGLHTSQRMYDLRIIPKLVSVFRQYRPDIVHCYYKISVPGRIAAKIAGVPIIICNEVDMEWEGYGFGLALTAKIKRKLDCLADKVIACSEAVRKYWDRSNSPKYVVIKLPIDLTKFGSKIESSSKNSLRNGCYPIIGMVSRLFPGKGHEYLIQAMPKILASFPAAKLRIVGSGPLLPAMEKFSRSLELAKSVEFAGFVADLREELSSFDVFVLPSLSEGFPLSILEAMATGLPVAATPVGGTPEIVEPGETGILFPPKDPEALADAVIAIVSDPDKAKLMGELGRQKVLKEFSPEVYMNKLDMLYQELLTAKGLM